MTTRYQKITSLSCSGPVPDTDNRNPDEMHGLAMPGYISAQELAGLCLPGLPTTKRNVNNMASREGWAFVDRAGRGGGRLYAVTDLPEAARAALLERRIASLSGSTASPGRPRGTDYFAQRPEVAAAVEVILAHRRLAAARVMELLASDFMGLPSRRTLQRFMAQLEDRKRALFASVRDPDAYKGRYKVALGRSDASVTYAHELWELDTTKADVLTAGGRKMILGLIDRWSRRARFMVAESESGQAVRNFLIGTIREWGVMPTAVMTDNGSGYINASIRSALEVLGIEHRVAPPGTPEHKPHVERLFGTFTRERAELLAGYVGHNVADAQALRARARKETGRAVIVPELQPQDLQTILDAWVDGVYHMRDHGSLRMSPMRRWQSSPVPPRAAPDDAVLRIALSKLEGTRRCGKRGVVWKEGRYWSPALVAWIGRDVVVRRDEEDLGQLYIFTPENEFIDTAVNQQRSGMSEEAFAREAKRQQAEYMAVQRAELRARARNFSVEDAIGGVLLRDAEAAGKLVHLPPRTSDAPAAPGAASIKAAVGPNALPAPVPEMPGTNMGAAEASNIIPMPPRVTSPETRVRETDALIARAAAGEQVDEAELRRAHVYRQTSEYRAFSAVAAAFEAGVKGA